MFKTIGVVNLVFSLCCLPGTSQANDFNLTRLGNVLSFEGYITPDSAKAVTKALEHNTDVFLIDSFGGDAAAGLQIANEIRKADVLVIVNRYCLSSCANYIFVGAKRKILNSDGIVGFHGGLTGSPPPVLEKKDYPFSTENELKKAQIDLQQQYLREADFYKSIGFNPEFLKKSFDLTKLEKPERYIEIIADKKNYHFELKYADKAKEKIAQLDAVHKSYEFHVVTNVQVEKKFYFPKKETLEKYGVKGIEKYEYPRNPVEIRELKKGLDKEYLLPGLILVGDDF
jgi:hypothetical protein